MRIEYVTKLGLILATSLCLPCVGYADELISSGQPSVPIIQETVPLSVAEQIAQEGQPLTDEQKAAVAVMERQLLGDTESSPGKFNPLEAGGSKEEEIQLAAGPRALPPEPPAVYVGESAWAKINDNVRGQLREAYFQHHRRQHSTFWVKDQRILNEVDSEINRLQQLYQPMMVRYCGRLGNCPACKEGNLTLQYDPVTEIVTYCQVDEEGNGVGWQRTTPRNIFLNFLEIHDPNSHNGVKSTLNGWRPEP